MNKNEINWSNPLEIELILKESGCGNIDNESGIICTMNDTKERYEKSLEQKKYNVSDLITELNEFYGIRVEINEEEGIIDFYDSNGAIGKISKGQYVEKNFYSDKHLLFEISEEYRGLGLGSKIFDLYKAISESNSAFIIFEEEYTNYASMINLYQKKGYILKYKIIDGNYEDLNKYDLGLINGKIDYSRNGQEETVLPFSVVLGLNY